MVDDGLSEQSPKVQWDLGPVKSESIDSDPKGGVSDQSFAQGPGSPSDGHNKLATGIDFLVLLTICSTIVIQPWLLGSALAVARFLLVSGAVLATCGCMVSLGLRRPGISAVHVAAMLLLGMAAIGVLQLMPIHPDPLTSMSHAVFPEFRGVFESAEGEPAEGASQSGLSNGSGSGAGSSETLDGANIPREIRARVSQTLCSADTRAAVAQWMALAMLLMASFLTVTSQPRFTACLITFVINGGILTIVSMLQMFGDGSMIIGGDWKLSNSTPFGPFVNPNNAAGWLSLHLAAAIALCTLTWGPAVSSGYSRSFGKPGFQDQFWSLVVAAREKLSGLTNRQIVVLSLAVLMATGIACTLSRAGILAGLFGLLAGGALRMKWRQAVLVFLPVCLLVLLAFGFLALLDLDTLVIDELSTLKDPVSESTGRILHWTDSAHAVLDFPLIGSGLNAYQYSTLPYQRHAFEKWFRHADNQFVEVVVEAGLVGLLLFCGVGILGIVAAVRLNRSTSQTTRSNQRVHTRSWRLALALMAIIVVVTQVVSAAFDFGLTLPANSGLFSVLLGMVCVPFCWDLPLAKRGEVGRSPRAGSSGEASSTNAADRLLPDVQSSRAKSSSDVATGPGNLSPERVSSSRRRRRKSALPEKWLLIPVRWSTLIVLQLCLVLSASMFLKDLWAASEINFSFIRAEKTLKEPMTLDRIQQLSSVRQTLESALKSRPDDPYGLVSHCKIVEAQFRWMVLNAIGQERKMKPEQQLKLWPQWTTTAITVQVLAAAAAEDPRLRAAMAQDLALIGEQYPWPEYAAAVLKKFPLQPGLALDLFANKLAKPVPQFSESLLSRALFTEPANARRAFQLGYFCLESERRPWAEKCWKHAVATSENIRPTILLTAASYWPPDQAVALFAPADYVSVVAVAQSLRNGELRSELLLLAENKWSEILATSDNGNPRLLSLDQQLARLQHLAVTQGVVAADDWAKSCIAEDPANLKLGAQRATFLEKNGQPAAALDEWRRVQYFHPGETTVLRAIDRLEQDL